jgi:CubicO group peptidase (beta-lactamase class C family)
MVRPNFLARATVAAALLLVPAALLPTAARAQQAAAERALHARTDSVFARFQQPGSPGCALSVVRAGDVVYSRGYGASNLEHGIAITPASRFHVASVSKQFTAFAIALLAEDGVLSIDDDIRRWLPEVPDLGHQITIRHLIHHTSGLRDQWELFSLAGWRGADVKTEGDVLEFVRNQRALNFPPGDQYLYSNTGYTLLAIIVERASGSRLREFAEARIFRPLGMRSTHFQIDHTEIVPGRTHAYAARQGGGYRISLPIYDNVGATSLHTTVEDLARWDRNFQQPVVGARSAVQQMYEQGRLNDGTQLGYAFALQIAEFRGNRVVEHSGSDAGYRAHFMRVPEQGMAVAVLCNVSDANPTALARQVADLWVERRAAQTGPAVGPRPAPPAARAVQLPESELRRYAGAFWNDRTATYRRIVLRDGKLFGGQAGNQELVPLGDGVFQPLGQNGRIRFGSSDGGAEQMEETSAAGARLEFRRVSGTLAEGDALADFAGLYYSEELDVTYRIAIRDGRLVVQRRRFSDQVMTPVFGDAFNAGRLFRFSRDRGGYVDGFEVTGSRVRNVRFNRIGN